MPHPKRSEGKAHRIEEGVSGTRPGPLLGTGDNTFLPGTKDSSRTSTGMDESTDGHEIRRRLPGARVVRRARRTRLTHLARVLGVPALFSTCYGNVGSSIYYALGVTAIYALGATPLVFLIAGAIFLCTALSYAEGTAAYPEAGGSASFARHGLGEVASFFAGWSQILDFVVTIAISAFAVPNYMAGIAPALAVLGQYPGNVIGGVTVVLMLVLLNVIGIRETTLLNIILALVDLLTQVLLMSVGAFLLFNWHTIIENLRPALAPTPHQFLYGISIGMIAYTGIETISNMAEEVRNPAKAVPRAIGLVFLAVIVMYTGLPLVALSAMPVTMNHDTGQPTTTLVSQYKEDPVLGIASALPESWARLFRPWIGMLASTILIIATNAGIIGISRLALSMGSHMQLPRSLGTVHRRFRTPYVSIILFPLAAVLLIIPGRIEFLAEMYGFGAMLSFSMAHSAVLALRKKKPNLERPFVIKPNIKVGGTGLPVTTLIGLAGTFGAWIVIVLTHPAARVFGFAWLAVGAASYVLYRRKMGLRLNVTITARDFLAGPEKK
jgi:APA family basic amino acid/polyamine antiporter